MNSVEQDLDQKLRITVGQYSSAGIKNVNQDSVAARIPDGYEAIVKGAALAIADGISSSETSQIASETAVRALVTDYYATPDAWTVKTAVRRVVEATNSWIYAQNRYARTSDLNKGLVCTLSAVVFKAREAHIFHVGDSRICRLLDDDLEPLTEDHLTVLSESEHYLGRAIGAQERVDIDYNCVPLALGDVFLLTTDGVHEFIDSDVVHEALAMPTLDDTARCIAERALQRGSTDNVSVQVARIDGLPTDVSTLGFLADELPIPGSLTEGDKLDGFQLIREIHNTYRSRLMLAQDLHGNRAVIKIPGGETGENPEYLQRFMFEEWVARRVNSPHIIKTAESSMERSASYVAMRWIDGFTLRQWIIDNPDPPLEDVRAIAEQVARGLRALHRKEMIHQDLRPENVMLDRDGTVVIIDLGSVAVAGLAEAAPGLMGAMPGTYQYTAPEYLSGDRVTWRADQYALAVIVYEMLTGRLPYGAQVARIRSRRDQQRLKYAPADVGERSVPEWVDFALARACHKDPIRRYDAFSEFLADLRTPAAGFIPKASRPLIDRDPLVFWRSLAGVQLIVILALLFVLLN